LRSTAVRDEVQRLASKYDDIIIDVGGRDTVEQRAAIALLPDGLNQNRDRL
jgi:chromosome partitioning protein